MSHEQMRCVTGSKWLSIEFSTSVRNDRRISASTLPRQIGDFAFAPGAGPYHFLHVRLPQRCVERRAHRGVADAGSARVMHYSINGVR